MGDNKNDPLKACGTSSYDGNSCTIPNQTCCNMHKIYWMDTYKDGYKFYDKGTATVCDYQAECDKNHNTYYDSGIIFHLPPWAVILIWVVIFTILLFTV